MLNGGGGGGGGAGMCTVVAACDSCKYFKQFNISLSCNHIDLWTNWKNPLLEFVDPKWAVACLVVHVSVIAPVALICLHLAVVVVRFAELDSIKKKCFFFV